MQLSDTAGQERFLGLVKTYFKNAHGIILLYDLTSKDSYFNTSKWLKDIKDTAENDICIILVGHKVDLNTIRNVEKDSAQKLAKSYKIDYIEASAKTNYNISEAINILLKNMYQVYGSNYPLNKKNSIRLKDIKNIYKKKKSNCC